MQELPDKLVFTIRDTLKTSRPGKHLEPIHILAYSRDLRLCPVTRIKEYLAQTQAIRTTTYFLISCKKLTTAVTNSTVATWVKSIFKDAGIDIGTFSVHSSRTAASSHGLLSGLPLKEILKAGGWSNAEVFACHYNKPIAQNFGNAVLELFSSSVNNDSSYVTQLVRSVVTTGYHFFFCNQGFSRSFLRPFHTCPFFSFCESFWTLQLFDLRVLCDPPKLTLFKISWYSVVT